MKQIVVATDFSNCAGNAMQYAIELAKILKLEVCAIHAISSTEGIDNSVYRAIFIEEYYARKRQALADWAASFGKEEGNQDVPITSLCEVGSVSKVLTTYIDSHPVELLVMGSMGATGIKDLFGSNVTSMVLKTRVPTLVIPLNSRFSANPVITLATDFESDLSPEDVTALNELLLAFDPDNINVLNVVETPEFKTNEAGESSLRRLIKNASLEFKYVRESNAAVGIMNFIQNNHTDILCLVRHHHNFILQLFNRSTVNQVMNKSVKAVLVLHA